MITNAIHALTRVDYLPRVSMMPHALTRAPLVLWCHDDIILHYFLTRLSRPTQFDPFTWPGPNCLHQKKKKKKKLWPSLNFDLDQKVKVGLSHSIFWVHFNFGIHFFIRDSEIIQTAQFLKSWLLHESWPKVKIFKTDLSHSVFHIRSDFGIHFFVWDSEIVQTVQFPESWLLHKSWPKVKIFKKDLYCPIFRIDSNFGVYSSFENPKLLK